MYAVATGTLSCADTPPADRGTAFPRFSLGVGNYICGEPDRNGEEILHSACVVRLLPQSRYYAISPVFTVGAVASVPAAPSFDFVEPGGAKQLRMRWTLLDDGGHHISHFELQRSTDSGNTWDDAGIVPPVPGRHTTWYDSGLDADTAYAYRVRAIADGDYEGARGAGQVKAN